MDRKHRSASFESLESRRLLTVDMGTLPGVTFSAPKPYAPTNISGNQISASAYVDLDGDGNRDLVYGISSVNGVSVAKSIGGGRFEASATSFDLPEPVWHIVATDIDGDAVTDLVASGQRQVFIMLGQTSDDAWSGFVLKQTINVQTNSIDLGDVDGDGNVDLLLANSQAVVYTGAGDGTFGNSVSYAPPAKSGDRKAKLFDVDSDDDLDLITSSMENLIVLRNDGGIFETQSDAIPGTRTHNATFELGDANSDGKPDLWLSHGSMEHAFVSLHTGNGDGTFAKDAVSYEVLGPPLDIKMADMNGDGRTDLVVGHDNTFHHPVNNNGPGGVSLLLANQTGSYQSAIRITTPNATAVFVDDTNRDGVADIISTHGHAVNVFEQRTSGLLEQQATIFQASDANQGFRYSAVGDLNGDAIADFAIASYDWGKEVGRVDVLLGNSDGSYEQNSLSLSNAPGAVYIGNFDDDTEQEIAVLQTDFRSSKLTVVGLDEQGEFQAPLVTPLQAAWSFYSTLDINSDGIMDFLGASDGFMKSLVGSASGRFTSIKLAQYTGFNPPQLADFNHDGNLDFAVPNSDDIEVYLSNADGTFDNSFSQRYRFADMKLGDFDGDRNTDIAYTTYDDVQVHIVYGVGDGSFGNRKSFDRTPSSALQVADFNDDGLSDLLFDSYLKFEVYLNTGEAFESTGAVFTPHSVGQITAADLDGDGDTELLLTSGLDFSTPQAQLSVVNGLGADSSLDIATTTFSNTLLPGLSLYDVNDDGVEDIIVPSLTGFFVVKATQPERPSGDINLDGAVDIRDTDNLCRRLHDPELPVDGALHDLNGDNSVDLKDVEFLVESVLGTVVGDVNSDGVFNSSDFVVIFQSSEYEDATSNNSMWSEGDWSCDGDFATSDFVYAFQKNTYTNAARHQQSNVRSAAIVDKLFAGDEPLDLFASHRLTE